MKFFRDVVKVSDSLMFSLEVSSTEEETSAPDSSKEKTEPAEEAKKVSEKKQ